MAPYIVLPLVAEPVHSCSISAPWGAYRNLQHLEIYIALCKFCPIRYSFTLSALPNDTASKHNAVQREINDISLKIYLHQKGIGPAQ